MASTQPETSILVAMTRQRVIGRGGVMPWQLSEELELFKALTWGATVLMGRKTFQSIGRPLAGRNNIVISRTLSGQEGVTVCSGLKEGLAVAERLQRPVFVIGGAEIYRQALPLADRLLISLIQHDYPGDVHFPAIAWSEWILEEVREYRDFCHGRYRRRSR